MMSGEYGKLYKRIWGDPDFRALTADEQLLFLKLFSQTDINMAGVLTLATTRWAKQTSKLSVATVERALKSLEHRGYIVVDPDTQEVLIRSYIKNDGGWKSYKTLRGVVNAVRRVLSPRLRAVISGELARIDTSGLRTEPLQSGLVPRDETEREIALLVEENPPQEGVSDGVSDRAYPPSRPTNANANTNANAPTNTNANALAAAPAETDPPADSRGTRIPPDYMPSPRSIELIARDYPEYDTKSEHPNFVDYWLGVSGQRGVKLDWEATWRKWMRTNAKEAREKQSRGYRNQNQIMADIHKQAAARDAESTSALALIEGAGK